MSSPAPDHPSSPAAWPTNHDGGHSLGVLAARQAEALHLARIGNWELGLFTGRLYWSDTIFEIFEIDPSQFGASYEAFLERVHPDDRSAVDEPTTRRCAIGPRIPSPTGC